MSHFWRSKFFCQRPFQQTFSLSWNENNLIKSSIWQRGFQSVRYFKYYYKWIMTLFFASDETTFFFFFLNRKTSWIDEIFFSLRNFSYNSLKCIWGRVEFFNNFFLFLTIIYKHLWTLSLIPNMFRAKKTWELWRARSVFTIITRDSCNVWTQ